MDDIRNYSVPKIILENANAKYYLAKNNLLNKEIILGELKYSKENISEAQNYSNIIHKSVSTLYDLFEINGKLYKVLEYNGGELLNDEINKNNKIAYEKIMLIFEQICYAMIHSKKTGIDYWCISPEMITMNKDFQIKIFEFGDWRYSKYFGKFNIFNAPEEVSGNELNTKTDIYRAGMIVYALLTNLPVQNDNEAIKDFISNNKLPDLSDQFFELGNIIKRMTEKNPDKRYPNFEICMLDLYNTTIFRSNYYSRNLASRKVYVEGNAPLLNVAFMIECKGCENEIPLSFGDIATNYVECHICEELNDVRKQGIKYVAICSNCDTDNEISKDEYSMREFTCAKCGVKNEIAELEFTDEEKNDNHICNECGSVVELDDDELTKKTFICPECGTKNVF